MGFHAYLDPRDADDILVVDTANNVLTALKRQDDLFAKGFEFEAAIARAAMVEGLALHYLYLSKSRRQVPLDSKTVERLKKERITFGQVKDALVASKAFHDANLEVELDAYVQGRNHVAHHVAAGAKTFDLRKFFEDGRRVGMALWQQNCADVKKANPPP